MRDNAAHPCIHNNGYMVYLSVVIFSSVCFQCALHFSLMTTFFNTDIYIIVCKMCYLGDKRQP